MADSNLPVLRKGDSGSTVALLQTFLRIKGFGTSLDPSRQLHGNYGLRSQAPKAPITKIITIADAQFLLQIW